MSAEVGRPLLSRRNGRPVACNPCRARKVACDHQRPICNRCRKRRQSDQCRYPEISTPSTTPTNDSTQATTDARAEPATNPVFPPRPVYLTSSSPSPGFFGFTSSTSIFEETESALALLLGSTHVGSPKPPGTEQNEVTISFGQLPVPLRETCLVVLRCLPGQMNEQMVYSGPSGGARGWADIAVGRIMQSLQTNFGDILAQGNAGLAAMSEILCSNTRRPMYDECTDSQQWLDQFCGKNLRWESIGLLWANLARISNVMDAMRNPILQFITEGKESMETARTCLENCIQLARHFTEANDLLLDLWKRFATLCSVIDGDAEMSSHAPHGVSVAMLTYMGLHVLENGPSYRPTLCSENKRRLAAMVFSGDKLGVAFTGRPPLISRRYYSTPLPLDIRDEDLAADEATLLKAFYSLDEEGWNTEGRIYPSTMMRARSIISFIRDELTEVALGKGVYVTIDQLLNIKERACATSSQFPSGLVYHPNEVDDMAADPKLVYLKIITHLDYLQNIFFAERLLLRHGHLDDGDLLVTSFEMVILTLKLWIHKDRFSDLSMLRNYEWLVMAYGAPGGGILCQELLYPTFSGTHHKHAELTRSSIVQQLSLLIGFLDWVRPCAPNGALCADAKTVIQRILDHHLNSTSGGEDIIDSMDWGVFPQPDFNFQLLDTFEWMRTCGG